MHDCGYLHRDLKPENIMIGQGKKAPIIYFIDFGLAKRYMCPNSGQHIEHKPNKGVFGTTRYLSKNANRGWEQSRVDDLIALGHILVMFLRKGDLPWDMEPLPEFFVDDKDPLIYKKTIQYEKDCLDWDRKYLEKKVSTTIQDLTDGLPGPWVDYFKYCDRIRYEQRPDYAHLRSLFEVQFKEKILTWDD